METGTITGYAKKIIKESFILQSILFELICPQVWWVGPIAAAFVGAGMYKILFDKPEPVKTTVSENIPLNDKA